MARGRPAGAAAPPTQAPGHEHDTEPAGRRRAEQVLGRGLQFDTTTDGRPVKIASIVDEHTANVSAAASNETSPATTSSTNSTASPSNASIPSYCAATTAPNWPARDGALGPHTRRAALHPTRRAVAQRLRRVVQLPDPRRTPEHQSSGAWHRPAWSSPTGRRTTTRADGTAHSATRHPRSMPPPASTSDQRPRVEPRSARRA